MSNYLKSRLRVCEVYLIIYCKSRVIADKVKPANSFFARFMGLMGKKHLGEGEGLLLSPCSSIHCFFMKMTIDAVYLSKDMTVLRVETLSPWKLGSLVKGTTSVLELGAGSATVCAGDVLDIHNGNKP